MANQATSRCPSGVGIGLRREHYGQVLETDRQIDWLEFVPENYVGVGGRRKRMLSQCRERWRLIAHGVSLSLGGRDPFDADYVSGLKTLLDEIDAPYYTDHLCYSAIDGIAYYDLLPLPFTDEAVTHVAGRIRELADRLERPVAVENISYYADMPGTAMSHGAFVSAVTEEADCGLLLDVNNVFVNATNHELEPLACLEALPLQRTVQMHLAGHLEEDGRLIDNHGAPVADPVWTLFEQALARTAEVTVLLEWDTDIPALDRVLDEADRAREFVMAAHASEQPPKKVAR